MKKIISIFLILISITPQLFSQRYIILGGGGTAAFYNSQDLKLFKDSYNSVYQRRLKKFMKGLRQPYGLRGEVGFRYFNSFDFALLAGIQNYSIKDVAEFHTGDSRYFELKMNSLFFEGEMGHKFNNIFVNGVLTFFFNRKITLNSSYAGLTATPDTAKALDGNYKGDSSFSTDVGIVVGILKDPVILSCKITYPIYTAGGYNVLQDNSKEKITNGTNIFPDNYDAYLYREPYHGVKSNIDGLKILVTVVFALSVEF